MCSNRELFEIRPKEIISWVRIELQTFQILFPDTQSSCCTAELKLSCYPRPRVTHRLCNCGVSGLKNGRLFLSGHGGLGVAVIGSLEKCWSAGGGTLELIQICEGAWS